MCIKVQNMQQNKKREELNGWTWTRTTHYHPPPHPQQIQLCQNVFFYGHKNILQIQILALKDIYALAKAQNSDQFSIKETFCQEYMT